jgi:predicted acylesterase/phospholipase RssA
METYNRYDFNPGGFKKVLLSIDGGGMRGIIPLAMLAELEAQLGRPIYEMVDMVGGTSTGAVIAAGIGLGMSAQTLLDQVYKDRLPAAFPPRNVLFWLRYLAGGLRHLYDIEPFRRALAPLAMGKTIGDLGQPIVLLTVKDLRTSNTYFVVSRGPGAPAFADWPVVGAVAASGAAPIFFPPILGNLIDGGTGVYGNPCLAVAVEAMEYIGVEAGFVDEEVVHLSLGTGYQPNDMADGAGARLKLFDWLAYVILEGLDEASIQQVLATRAIYGERTDFRRYNPLLTRASITNTLDIHVPPDVDPIRLGLDSTRPAEIALMEAVGRAYARLIDWREPALMPWDTPGGHPMPRIAPVDWRGTPYV